MDEPTRCETCGATLSQGAHGSVCPRCLFSLALDPGYTDTAEPEMPFGEEAYATASTRRSGVTIGRYRLVRKIGAGAMGAVYEAQQDHPRRTVALKLFKPKLISFELLRRFELESQALARLQHPGIAQIYEAGTADTGFGPQPFFAMEFIQGDNLQEYVEKHQPGIRQRLEIVAKVCEAVHHAHQRGLIHRDLKPANILVDETGQPKVLDFGVARITDRDAQMTPQTSLGQLVGTLAYMSPEQALADPLELDTRSDVYTLGVILYELLSGRLPYDVGIAIPDALRAIREEDPAPLSSINRKYRGDIETIVAKALEKDKARRYSSATELASDLRRHLNDEPIIARPPGTTYQLQKFARRHKALVGSVAAVFVVLTGGILASTWQAVRAGEERDRARKAETAAGVERDRATAAESATSMQRDLALRAMEEAGIARNQAAAAETQALKDRDRITWQSLARESVRLSTSRADDELAALLARQAFLIHGRTPDQPRFLIEEALQQAARLNPWSRKITGHQGIVNSVAFSSDNVRLASGSVDRTLRVWNLNEPDAAPVIFAGFTGSVNAVAFSPDGKHVASGTQDEVVKIWNLRESGAAPLSPAGYGPGPVFSLAFSPDGARLAISGFNGVWIWDLRTPALAPRQLPGPRLPARKVLPFTSIAFSPDGLRVAAGDLFGGVRVWDLRAPDVPVVLTGHPGRVNAVAFAPDGIHLASAGSAEEDTFGPRRGRGFEPGSGKSPDWSIRLWDLTKPSAPPVLLQAQESQANSVAFAPDGKRLASAGSDGILRVWDLTQLGASPLRLPAHEEGARSVAFSPDGKRLATAGNDYSVRLWNLNDSGLPIKAPQPHQASVESLAFSPDNAYLASGSADKTVRLWDVQTLAALPISLQHEDVVRPLAFSRDGALLASVTPGSLRIWKMSSLETPAVLLQDRQGFQSVAFSQDGTAVASVTITNPLIMTMLNERGQSFVLSQPPAVKRWELRKNSGSKTILEDPGINSDVMAFTEDWKLFASVQADNSIRVWDLDHPNSLPVRFTGAKGLVSAVALSRSESRLAAVSRDLMIRVWDTRNPEAPLFVFRGGGNFVAFSLDDTRLVTGGIEAADVRVWDLREPGDPPVVLKAGNAAVRSIALSRDGSYLAVGDADGNLWMHRLWSSAADYLCTRVSRNLSLEEWRFYVGESISYERTCKAMPAGTGTPASRRSSP